MIPFLISTVFAYTPQENNIYQNSNAFQPPSNNLKYIQSNVQNNNQGNILNTLPSNQRNNITINNGRNSNRSGEAQLPNSFNNPNKTIKIIKNSPNSSITASYSTDPNGKVLKAATMQHQSTPFQVTPFQSTPLKVNQFQPVANQEYKPLPFTQRPFNIPFPEGGNILFPPSIDQKLYSHQPEDKKLVLSPLYFPKGRKEPIDKLQQPEVELEKDNDETSDEQQDNLIGEEPEKPTKKLAKRTKKPKSKFETMTISNHASFQPSVEIEPLSLELSTPDVEKEIDEGLFDGEVELPATTRQKSRKPVSSLPKISNTALPAKPKTSKKISDTTTKSNRSKKSIMKLSSQPIRTKNKPTVEISNSDDRDNSTEEASETNTITKTSPKLLKHIRSVKLNDLISPPDKTTLPDDGESSDEETEKPRSVKTNEDESSETEVKPNQKRIKAKPNGDSESVTKLRTKRTKAAKEEDSAKSTKTQATRARRPNSKVATDEDSTTSTRTQRARRPNSKVVTDEDLTTSTRTQKARRINSNESVKDESADIEPAKKNTIKSSPSDDEESADPRITKINARQPRTLSSKADRSNIPKLLITDIPATELSEEITTPSTTIIATEASTVIVETSFTPSKEEIEEETERLAKKAIPRLTGRKLLVQHNENIASADKARRAFIEVRLAESRENQRKIEERLDSLKDIEEKLTAKISKLITERTELNLRKSSARNSVDNNANTIRTLRRDQRINEKLMRLEEAEINRLERAIEEGKNKHIMLTDQQRMFNERFNSFSKKGYDSRTEMKISENKLEEYDRLLENVRREANNLRATIQETEKLKRREIDAQNRLDIEKKEIEDGNHIPMMAVFD